ncbi:MAG: hypothetical protein ACRDVM_09495, partial [Acidimicrobiia bacterium]
MRILRDRPGAGRARTSVVLMAALAGLAVGVALAFAEADQAQRIAADAQRLQRAEETLSASAVARANLSVALALFADGEGSPDARAAVEASFAAVAERAAALTGNQEIVETAYRLVEAVDGVLGLLGQSDGAAVQAAQRTVLPLAGALDTQVLDLRDELAARIAAEQGAAGQLARLTSLTVAL